MAIVTTDDQHYKNIAEKIREMSGTSEKLTPESMPTGVQIACNQQYNAGHADGYDAGKNKEYDRFWDAFQQKGSRSQYNYAFGGIGWTMDTFRPKYDIVPLNVGSIFYQSNIENLEEALRTAGIKFDTSKITNFASAFYYSFIKTIPAIDCTGCENTASPFAGMFRFSEAVTIRKIILPANGNQTFSSTFHNMPYLQNISFEGVIGQNISFPDSPLSAESMKNIIDHLKNYKGTENEAKYAVTFTNNSWANLEADSAAPDGGTWKNFVASLGWNY